MTGLPVVDLFFEPGMFSYGNGQFVEVSETNAENGVSYVNEPVLRSTFNDTMNVNWWDKWMSNPGTFDSPSAEFTNLDRKIEESYQKTGDILYVFGTPLTPSMPASVCVRFWVLAEKTSPNAPDFKQLFTQILDVPVGATRQVPNTLLPSPG